MLLRMALFFLNYPVRISQKSCRATVGYACFNPVLGSVEDTIKRADRMMYHYKRKRKSEALTNDDTVKS